MVEWWCCCCCCCRRRCCPCYIISKMNYELWIIYDLKNVWWFSLSLALFLSHILASYFTIFSTLILIARCSLVLSKGSFQDKFTWSWCWNGECGKMFVRPLHTRLTVKSIYVCETEKFRMEYTEWTKWINEQKRTS